MSVQLISREHYTFICEMFEGAESSVKIISPFIGSDMAQLMTDNMTVNPALKVEIITRFYREDFINGVSKIAALEKLHNAGAKIYALIGLHTKLYLFDTGSALLGSANFTSGGFKLNHELSLCVIDEDEVSPQLVAYFDDFVKAIIQSGDYLLTSEKIADEKRIVESITKKRKDRNTEYRNEARFGAKISLPSQTIDTEESDTIQAILSVASSAEGGNTIWLKFEGSANRRRAMTEKYSIFTKLSPNGTTFFSEAKKPTNVKEGDYIYMAVYCEADLPYIVGRGRSAGYRDENVVTPNIAAEYEWMFDYPHYYHFNEFEYIDTTISECIPLSEALTELGSNFYVSTEGKSLLRADLRIRHRQQAHMRLTSKAKAYIDNLFDDLVKKHGVNRLPNKHESAALQKDESIRVKFWEKAHPVLRNKTKMYDGVKSLKHQSISSGIGYGGIIFYSAVNDEDANVTLLVYCGNDVDKTKKIFYALKSKQKEIESNYEYAKDWEWNDEEARTCNIRIHFKKYGLNNEEHWDEIITFFVDNNLKLIEVFEPLLDTIFNG